VLALSSFGFIFISDAHANAMDRSMTEGELCGEASADVRLHWEPNFGNGFEDRGLARGLLTYHDEAREVDNLANTAG
jgi:hypothetical protein